ncbi:MAG: hypothetical protein HWQ23_19880 [Nostoc sp. JL33]|uniref:hypothetical protein n=1 Tax=Nostoc sp. JL33 TaxID=2815396 RepID=UPI0025D22F3E|nr:hypothetical protein [Nostoc sp. JL33]MBN3872459.1 hypothetical protein [Nostoc sp. JL33]
MAEFVNVAKRLPLGEATGATRREVGAAASAVGAARRRHLNFGRNKSLRDILRKS